MDSATKTAAEAVNDDTCQERMPAPTMLQSIKTQFASLVAQVLSTMKIQQVEVADVHHFLNSLFEDNDCSIPEVPDLTKLFASASDAKLWHYDHCASLKELVEKFLPTDESIRKHVAEYESALPEFYATTNIGDFVNLSKQEKSDEDTQKIAKHNRKVTMILKIEEPTSFSEITLDYVYMLWKGFMEELNLFPHTAVIDRIVEDRFEITWLTLPRTASKIKVSFSKVLRFYQKHSVAYVSIDGGTLYDIEWIDGSTPLYQASFMGNTDEVEELLKGGANVNQQNENRWRETALFGSCQNGHADAIKLLIDHGATIDHRSMYAETPLSKACYYGNLKPVSMLVKAGAKIDMGDMDGVTGLMWASNNGHTEVVKFLLEAKANFNTTDNVRWTALICASRYGHTDIVKMLVDCGSVVDHKNKFGDTSLTLSCCFGNWEVVAALLKAGARTDIVDSDGLTCLMQASYRGYINIVKALLEAKADLNITSEDGETAIFFAARSGHTNVVKILVENGAEVDHRNKDGLTALDCAKMEHHLAVCEVLEQQTQQDTETTVGLRISSDEKEQV